MLLLKYYYHSVKWLLNDNSNNTASTRFVRLKSYHLVFNATCNSRQSDCVEYRPIGVCTSKVQPRFAVLCQNERKYRVLHEVIDRSTGHLVQLSEILEIRHVTRQPALLNCLKIIRSLKVGKVEPDEHLVEFISVLIFKTVKQISLNVGKQTELNCTTFSKSRNPKSNSFRHFEH